MSEPDINLPKADVGDVAALFVPSDPDIAFGGFKREAFEVLDRLRKQPHIECYRTQKAAIEEYVKTPFKQYRDDLVVNFVLPNGLNLETERNVFSRLLKNDFGAGGCHHHKWLSFYRPDRRRITDIQLAHSLSPDGLRLSVYAGAQAKDAFEAARRRVLADPDAFLNLVNPLLQESSYHLNHSQRSRRSKTPSNHTHPLSTLPADFATCEGFAVRTTISRKDVISLEGALMNTVLQHVAQLWPVYRFLAGGAV